jgi:hypothetical protein
VIEDWSLKNDFNEALSVSSDIMWDKLSYKARIIFEDKFNKSAEKSFEETISNYFSQHKKFPAFYFDKLDEDTVLFVEDKIAHRLAERFESHLQTGRINLNDLDASFLKELDSSAFYSKVVAQTILGLEKGLNNAIKESGDDALNELELSFEDLLTYPEFGSLKLVNQLAELNYANSISLKRLINEILLKKGKK